MRSARTRSLFRCQNCDGTQPKWLGRCPECSEWNSLVEEIIDKRTKTVRPVFGGAAATPITQVEELDASSRTQCGIGELDRVLGGGLVPGSLVLLGGEPGVGKSTLLAHMLYGVTKTAGKVLYVSGEESVAQTAMRARRINAACDDLLVLAETSLERILEQAKQIKPAVLAIDSIQTIYTEALHSVPGSLAQVRECAGRLLSYAKTQGTTTILVGHVTKDGAIAGPKTLEHVVDTVLEFKGEGGSPYRILRALKNRFGSTQEIGVFEMRGGGLVEVANPSELFLAERPIGAPGSVVVASAEGSRPILVEVQALVAPSSTSLGRRTVAGVDANRVALLLAVLAQRAGCDVLSQDVFINVAGGVRLAEPAIDLGVACAIASSARGRAIDARTLLFGEVGLAGEIRAVNLANVRLAEAAKLGFRRCLLPKQNRARVETDHGMELVPVTSLESALDLL